jgi:hypothetical protein
MIAIELSSSLPSKQTVIFDDTLFILARIIIVSENPEHQCFWTEFSRKASVIESEVIDVRSIFDNIKDTK